MKKLLSFVLVLTAVLAVNGQNCTPNPIYADSSAGVWPNPFPASCIQAPYNLVIDIKTLTDTCVTSPLALCLDIQALRISSVTGLPTGFVADYPAQWTNLGTSPNFIAVQGCATITAPQSAVQAAGLGSHPITVNVDLYAKNQDPNSPILATYTWTSTIGVVAPYNFDIAIMNCIDGIEELKTDRFSLAPNFPNPFTGTTTIPFNTTKEEGMTLKVYNMVGMLVYETSFTSKAGKNMFVMNASKLQSGMYVFTMSNGKETFTRKMTVQN